MDIDKLRPLLERAARDEGLEPRQIELSPDGRTVVVFDNSGVAAIPAGSLEAIDLHGEDAYRHVARVWEDRAYGEIGEQETLDNEAFEDPNQRLRRDPEHPGHLGVDDEPPAGAARIEPHMKPDR
jgi:hypothetical protein